MSDVQTPTTLVHFDACPDDPYHPLSPPLYQTATFEQPDARSFGRYDYTRSGNPTRDALERLACELEAGSRAFAFASGMAALTAVARAASPGDEIVAGADAYGGTFRLLDRLVAPLGVTVRYVDTTDLDAVRAALSERTRLVFVETPSNPFQRITDLRAVADAAHSVDAWLVVDNSVLTPCRQNPLTLGADCVVHSATKFLSGHSDVTAGIVITHDGALADHVGFVQNAEGAGLAPFEAWLTLRGIRTLSLRVDRQERSAEILASRLASHGSVATVHYAGSPTHPDRARHAAQARGGGSILSFEVGTADDAARIVEATRLFKTAVSFGGVTSTISVPAHMSHASIPPALRATHAPPPSLIRVSIGIEDVEDLWADLDRAIRAGVPSARTADV